MRALAGGLVLGLLGSSGCFAESIDHWRAQIHRLPPSQHADTKSASRQGTVIVATGKLEIGGKEHDSRLWLYTSETVSQAEAIAIPRQAHGELVVGAPRTLYLSEELSGVAVLEQDGRLFLYVSATEPGVDVENAGRVRLSGWVSAPIWNDDPNDASKAGTAFGAAPPPSFWPATLPYQRGEPAPRGYAIEERPRWGIFGLGAGMVVVPYGLGLSLAAANGFENESWLMAIPVAGPALYGVRLHKQRSESDSQEGSFADLAPAFLFLDTGVQVGGIGLMIVALVRPCPLWRRVDERALRVRPVIFESGRGVVIEGRL